MIKNRVTVMSWKQGIALLNFDRKNSCDSCHSHCNCNIFALHQSSYQNTCVFEMKINQPLEIGQYIELGITKCFLLRSAMLVYLMPLFGMILGGILFEYSLENNIFSICGSFFGGVIAVVLAHIIANWLRKKSKHQFVILKIGKSPSDTQIQEKNTQM